MTDAEIIDQAVRAACELPGDDGIPDDQRLVMSVGDLRTIVHTALVQAREDADLRKARAM